ncbi:hypothetical protein V8Z80_08520 [Orrella sp. JC864]|uniref:hypothetical protein n=1 Tax=Orrella sp. JC864 TaxID=3120298 RepID=UPI00300B6EED
MGLRDEITADLAEAFDDDLADAIRPFEGSRVAGVGPYDPVTETRPGITETYSGRGAFGGYRSEEIDGVRVLATDVRLLALQAETTGTPAVGDKINGMRVESVGQDPAAVTWVVQLRKV